MTSRRETDELCREAAALLEGHGSIVISEARGHRRQMYLRVFISLSPRAEAVVRLRVLSGRWGGAVNTHPTYVGWQRSSVTATAFLVDVAPYLTWLRPAADVAFDFQDQYTRDPAIVALREYGEFQRECREAMRALTEPVWRLDGEFNPNAKLRIEEVTELRRRVAAGERQKAVASDLGLEVTDSMLYYIINGQRWNPPAGPSPRRQRAEQLRS